MRVKPPIPPSGKCPFACLHGGTAVPRSPSRHYKLTSGYFWLLTRRCRLLCRGCGNKLNEPTLTRAIVVAALNCATWSENAQRILSLGVFIMDNLPLPLSPRSECSSFTMWYQSSIISYCHCRVHYLYIDIYLSKCFHHRDALINEYQIQCTQGLVSSPDMKDVLTVSALNR